jgi:hypothetical protein
MLVKRPNRKSKRGIRFPAVHELKRNALAKINFMLPDVGHSAKFLAEISKIFSAWNSVCI